MSNLDAHWRDSARTPKFFVIDAQVFIPIVLCLFHFRLWTVFLCAVVAIILIVLNYFKLNIKDFLQLLRELIVGREKIVYRR
ncbi:IcmT/TraK family protein [Cysteiniphilum litorale]|uniref:IcmT/TraK family protein n=1 Tax=Cysteiniphilum litorale TaxID=2056700 RepID=UPI003F88042C